MKNITTVKLMKLVGYVCVGLVFCAMFLPRRVTILFGIAILLPLALYSRKTILKEEKETKNLLDRNSAVCGFAGICYEGNNHIRKGDVAFVYLKRKEIIINYGSAIDNLGNRFSISKESIKNVNLYTLKEIKEISITNRYDSLGKLGEYFYINANERKIMKNSHKDKKIRYLIIRYQEVKGVKVISVFEPSDANIIDLNRRASINNDVNTFCKETY